MKRSIMDHIFFGSLVTAMVSLTALVVFLVGIFIYDVLIRGFCIG